MSVGAGILKGLYAMGEAAGKETLMEGVRETFAKVVEEVPMSQCLRVATLGREVTEGLETGEVDPLALAAMSKGLGAFKAIPLKTEYASLIPVLQTGAVLQRCAEKLGVDSHLYTGLDSVRGALNEVGFDEPVTFLLDGLDKIKAFEQDCMKAADEAGYLVTAKNVEYLIGDDAYVEGIGTKLPLIGSLNQLAYKTDLDVPFTTADLIRAGMDIATLVSIALTMGATAPTAGAVSVGTEVAAVGAEAAALGAEAATVGVVTAGAEAAAVGVEGGVAAAAGAEVVAAEGIAAGVEAAGAGAEALSGVAQVKVGAEGVGAAAKETHAFEQVRAWRAGAGADLSKGRATFGDLRARKEALQPHLKDYISERVVDEPLLGRLHEGYTQQLVEARVNKLPGDIQRINRQISRGGSGELGRQITADTFRPYFNDVAFEHPITEGGKVVSRVDILAKDAKVPIVGRDFYVPQGGNLAIETKMGKDAYLASETKHMLFQTGKHTDVADASLTVVSKDIKDLPLAVESRMREALGQESKVFAMMWNKDVLDKALRDHVADAARKLIPGG